MDRKTIRAFAKLARCLGATEITVCGTEHQMEQLDEPRGFTEEERREIVKANEITMYPDMADKFKAMEVRAEWQRLKDVVVKAAVQECAMERTADYGSNTITRTDALIRMQIAMKEKREAVDALITFETKHGIDNQRA